MVLVCYYQGKLVRRRKKKAPSSLKRSEHDKKDGMCITSMME